MADRLVSVLGGTGFLGRRVVTKLIDAGFRVRVVARSPEKVAFEGVDDALMERQSADLRDEDDVAAAVEGASAAVNAVSLYVEQGALDFEAVHVEGAARLARLSRAAGHQALVHVSGIGSNPESESPLIRAKARGEQVVAAEFPDASIVRPSVMFGRDDAFLAGLDKATRPPVVPLFGSGAVKLQPAWVQDAAEAIVRLVAGAETTGWPLELGGAEILTYREAVTAVCDHLGRKRILVPFPMEGWKALTRVLGLLPEPPLTIDQLYLLARDNTVASARDGFAQLDMQPRGLIGLLDHCLP